MPIFSRRKRDEGFEWHRYVSETIKLRRQARRDRMLRAKQTAAEALDASTKAAARGGSAAARLGARHLNSGSRLAAAGLARLRQRLLAMICTGCTRLGRAALVALQPLSTIVARPYVHWGLLIGGTFASAVGVGRAIIQRVLDHDAAAAMLIGGLLLLLAALPSLTSGRTAALLQPLLRVAPRRVRGLAAACAVLLAMTAVLTIGASRLPFSTGSIRLPLATPLQIVEGRASVIGPGQLRVGSVEFSLGGLEAPDREQRCLRPDNRAWRCGDAAVQALQRLVANRALKCELGADDGTGLPTGICRDGDRDINAGLVQAGFAFAGPGYWAPYAGAEAAAKAAKAGLWAGSADRPKEWRSKVWQEASRRAPDGCPIKAPVARGAKVYVLPWSAQYDGVQVDVRRGGRWFCSEQDALGAGWKPSTRS